MPLCSAWATEADLCTPCDDYSLDTGLMEDYLLAASEALFVLSAQQFPGECSVDGYRPCSSGPRVPGVPDWLTPFTPLNSYYDRRFLAGCTCGTWDDCGCPPVSQITLPFDYVTDVTQVKVDGDVLATTDYRLDANSLLVSTTTTRWPCCQNIRLADTEEDTWSVDLTYGRPVPMLGVKAAGVLACELYLACQPEDIAASCRLPTNWTVIARQGVTVSRLVEQVLALPQRGPVRFGIPVIDAFLISTNPYGNFSQMVFLNPDDADLGRIVG